MNLMRKSLYWKLTLAFMLVAVITAGLVAVFIRVTSADRLSALIIDQQRDSLEQELVSYYQTNGSWDGVQENWMDLQRQSAAPAISTTQEPLPDKIVPYPGPSGISSATGAACSAWQTKKGWC